MGDNGGGDGDDCKGDGDVGDGGRDEVMVMVAPYTQCDYNRRVECIVVVGL